MPPLSSPHSPPTRTTPPNLSGILQRRPSARHAAEHLPGAHIVKAFTQLPANSLAAELDSEIGRRVIFIATDSATAGNQIADLVGNLGLPAVQLGRTDQGRSTDPGTSRARAAQPHRATTHVDRLLFEYGPALPSLLVGVQSDSVPPATAKQRCQGSSVGHENLISELSWARARAMGRDRWRNQEVSSSVSAASTSGPRVRHAVNGITGDGWLIPTEGLPAKMACSVEGYERGEEASWNQLPHLIP